ncbi:SDR family NAD(P)-dependent oxidoreductase [Streptomyces sp. NBC_01497]|uniref:SDR family NAD(P)-dependent oxidoreductase n=1 Tax=Streptomyces sp. NBC_01497 TaxID=2903885 RepID=UPI002E3611AC|nr:SDR family NAD(P)-dependent oxidoreductase [Streptomyces sp. NBC_01497]
MKDAFGAPQSVLLLGGTSAIGLATVRRLVARRARTVWLAGRPSPALDAAAEGLRTLRGGLGVDVRTLAFDALDPASHEEALGKVFAEGDIDLVLLAFGITGDQGHDEAAPLAAVEVAQTNYTGAVSASLVCAGAMQAQGHGALVVLSSVAGERARRADFIYGSSKAGLDTFAQGLRDAMDGTGVQVMTVRPGVVRGRDGTPEAAPGAAPVLAGGAGHGPFTTTPEEVATAIELGLRRRSGTVYVPGRLRPLMAALRHLPGPLYRAVLPD